MTSVLEHYPESALFGDRIVQRQVLYLGEINDSQQEAWLWK
jgi:hypothetical protein